MLLLGLAFFMLVFWLIWFPKDVGQTIAKIEMAYSKYKDDARKEKD